MLLAYTVVAVVTVLLTLALLAATKIPAVVMLLAATIVTSVVMAYGRLELGYWDPFAPIAATFCWFFTAIVSLAFIGVGRLLKWPFFLTKKPVQPVGG
jgi:hypothetical protein